MKAHIFLITNPKFQLQILCSLGDITKMVKLNGIPENNLCIFIIASSPGTHTFFCLWRVNKKLPQGETSQNAFQRSRSINWQWKICMFNRMGISTFNNCVFTFASEFRPNHAHALRFWCFKCTNSKGECIGQASKLKCKYIILSKFSHTK